MAKSAVLAFTDPEDLERRINDYFANLQVWRDEIVEMKDGTKITRPILVHETPPTMAGLGLALGVSRQTLLAYGKGEGNRSDLLVPIIARAKQQIEAWTEAQLYDKEAGRGAQFSLIHNHRYAQDDSDGTGEGFEMTITPPAEAQHVQAIPKWSESDE